MRDPREDVRPRSGRDRHIEWPGAFNARDLGGLTTVDGRQTRWGAVVRSDSPDRLTAAGWTALRRSGIRTIVDLRDPSESGAGNVQEFTRVSIPLLDLDDGVFWAAWRGVRDTPRFYRAVLERWDRRFAAAFKAVAHAEPGGVLIHCEMGRDRTGLIAALILAAVGVPLDAIDGDYALSRDRLVPLYEVLFRDAPDELKRTELAAENVAEAGTIVSALRDLDVDEYLRRAGVADDDFEAIRTRLLE